MLVGAVVQSSFDCQSPVSFFKRVVACALLRRIFEATLIDLERLRSDWDALAKRDALWAILTALIGGTLVFGALAVRTFRNRVVN